MNSYKLSTKASYMDVEEQLDNGKSVIGPKMEINVAQATDPTVVGQVVQQTLNSIKLC